MSVLVSSRRAFLLVTLLALTGLGGAQTRDPLPVPDVSGYRTLKCDFHMHTVFSDGEVWPVTRVAEAWRDGFDAIAITDHDGYHPHKEDVGVDLTRPLAIAQRAADQAGLLLVPGVEITKGNLHCNALFVTDPNGFGDLDLTAALQRAKSQGAFVFWNHPGWKGKAEWYLPIDAAHKDGMIQGIELLNGLDFYAEAYPWVEEKNLAILANSDVHRPIGMDYAPRTRPVTLVFARTADLKGIREALDGRRTAAWVNGQVWGPEPLVRGLWEGAVKPEGSRLQLKAGAAARQMGLRNYSAIPFQLRITGKPAWLNLRATDLKPESVGALFFSAAKEAPAGRAQVAIEVEVTNFHTGPNRNLSATIPLEIEVTP